MGGWISSFFPKIHKILLTFTICRLNEILFAGCDNRKCITDISWIFCQLIADVLQKYCVENLHISFFFSFSNINLIQCVVFSNFKFSSIFNPRLTFPKKLNLKRTTKVTYICFHFFQFTHVARDP